MATSKLVEEDLRITSPIDVRNVLEQVADSGITVKSQQLGEPDLTVDEKIKILREILNKNPATFLSRFGKVLSADNLKYFEAFKSDYEVEYRLNQLKKLTTKQARDRDIKNRRYACLQNLIQNTEYFSDEEMKHRNPLLYEQYVGQYMSQQEKDEIDSSQLQSMDKLSLRLLHQWDIQQNEKLLTMQKDFEEEMEEEEESSEEESDSSDQESENKTNGNSSTATSVETNNLADKMDTEWAPNEEERKLLHNELTLMMQQRFLNGEDNEFDYTQVDYCEDYDNLALRTQDEEEAYFDLEEPEDIIDPGIDNG